MNHEKYRHENNIDARVDKKVNIRKEAKIKNIRGDIFKTPPS